MTGQMASVRKCYLLLLSWMKCIANRSHTYHLQASLLPVSLQQQHTASKQQSPAHCVHAAADTLEAPSPHKLSACVVHFKVTGLVLVVAHIEQTAAAVTSTATGTHRVASLIQGAYLQHLLSQVWLTGSCIRCPALTQFVAFAVMLSRGA
jgi:hypothetical protein